MRLFQNSIDTPQKRISLKIFVLLFSWQSSSAWSMDKSEMRKIEEEISSADPAEQSRLEFKIARLLQNDATSTEANYLMSTLLLKMFTFDPGTYSLIRQSTELAAQIYDLDKKNELAIAALANILEVSGESSRGLALIKEAKLRGTKIGWRTRLTEARLHFNEKNYLAAITALEENLADTDLSKTLQSAVVIDVVGEYYKGTAQIKALELWKNHLQTDGIKLAYAGSLALSDNLTEAKLVFEQILKSDATNSEAQLSLGLIEQRIQKNSPKSEKHFRDAIANAKNTAEKNAAQLHLALHLINLKSNADAANDASINAIRDSNDREGVFIALANSHLKHSNTKAILNLLGRIEQEIPGLSLVYAIKGEVQSDRLGSFEDARISFSNAISLDRNRSEYFNGRGLTFMQMGKLENAVKDFEHATMVNPEDASSRYNFACALARLGRKNEALSSLSQAVTLDSKLQAHARQDSDLESLRSESEFQTIIYQKEIFNVGH